MRLLTRNLFAADVHQSWGVQFPEVIAGCGKTDRDNERANDCAIGAMRYHSSYVSADQTAEHARNQKHPQQPRSNTPLNWLRVRQTTVGYAKNRATALVASAVTG